MWHLCLKSPSNYGLHEGPLFSETRKSGPCAIGPLIVLYNEVFLKYNYIQVDNTCYKDLQTLASGYKVEYVLYIFISPAIFFYLFLSFFALF